MIKSRNVAPDGLRAYNLHPNLRTGLYIDSRGALPSVSSTGVTGAAAAGTTGSRNLWIFPGAASGVLESFVIGAGQTIYGPAVDATNNGINISGDDGNDEGFEFIPGGNTAVCPFGFTVGSTSSQQAFIRARFKATDISQTDEFMVGWRKQAASADLATLYTSYTDYHVIGIFTSAVTADVFTKQRLNSGTVTSTDTLFNWADNAIVELEARLVPRNTTANPPVASAVAQFFINGTPLGSSVSKDADGTSITAQPTVGPVLSFLDATDFFVPFIRLVRANTGLAMALRRFSCGFLADDGKDPSLE